MSLDDLSKSDLRALLSSPSRLRDYSLREKSTIVALIDSINQTLQRPDAPTRQGRITSIGIPSAVRNPEGVVNTVLRNIQAERFTGQEYTLEELTKHVESGIAHNKIPYTIPSSLMGFVAHTLYEHVLSKLPRARSAGSREVGIVDVRRRLRIDMDRTSKEMITGVVPADHLRNHYVFADGRICYQDSQGTHLHTQVEGVPCWDSEGKEKARIDLVNFVMNHLPLYARKPVHYLGLEGPAFGSFLPLAQATQATSPLIGTFVEYDSRSFQLMKSMQRAQLTELIQGDTFFGDVDDHSLLDFVKDPDVTLVRKEANGEAPGLYVRYAPARHSMEYIPLDNYHALLAEIPEQGSRKQLAKKYGISDRFLNAVSDRHEGTFDVVFLDYVGVLTTKRRQALEALISRRLGDHAVVAATINVAHRIMPRKDYGAVAQASSSFFDRATGAFNNVGYRVSEMIDSEYKEGPGRDAMCFQAYYVERRTPTK